MFILKLMALVALAMLGGALVDYALSPGNEVLRVFLGGVIGYTVYLAGSDWLFK